jgi:hypothetical protein
VTGADPPAGGVDADPESGSFGALGADDAESGAESSAAGVVVFFELEPSAGPVATGAVEDESSSGVAGFGSTTAGGAALAATGAAGGSIGAGPAASLIGIGAGRAMLVRANTDGAGRTGAAGAGNSLGPGAAFGAGVAGTRKGSWKVSSRPGASRPAAGRVAPM